ncbi:ulp1 protease family, C-terminal catalytic domain-containing protein [Tanacetum coccineum]
MARTNKNKFKPPQLNFDAVSLILLQTKKNVKEGNKVVEKRVSSKKAEQVAVESGLVPVDNDAPVSAYEEEVEAVIKKVAGGNKRKKDVNEVNKVDGKLVSFKKVKQVAYGSELVLVDNKKEGCKYDPVKIITRMSPVHLKNVLNTCTLTHIMDLNEMGLGHFHNNFNFESTSRELGMWVVKSYDPETHTLRMGDGRRIKVSREQIHEILRMPMGENKVISLPSTTSEDITTTNWRYTTPFTEDRIHITRVDDHVSSLIANGWPFKVGFFVVFFSILAQGNKDGTSGGFGKLPIFEGLEFIEPKKPKLKKKSKVLLLGDGSMSREQELEDFKTKTAKDMKDCLNDNVSKIKALLLDTYEKLKIALNENPEDSDFKMLLGKRLGFFKELYHRDIDNAMVVLHKGNDLREESVKDNEVLKEKDDVREKGKDVEKEMNKEKDVEKVVDQNLDKPEAVKDNKVSNEKDDVPEKGKDVEKVVKLGEKKSVQKVVDQNMDMPDDIEKESEFEISKKDSQPLIVSKEKDSESQTSIFDSQPEAQDSQPEMEIEAGIQEENLEPVKNCKTLEEADFPSIGFEDIESLKGGGRNLFDETNKLKLPKYMSPDGQAIVEKRQEDMLTENPIFCGKETKTFDSIKSKLVKKNDGMAQCMKEKSIDEVKGGHPTAKKQQIKKSIEGEKNVQKTRAKKTNADKQEIKKPQVRKKIAAQLAKSKETNAKTTQHSVESGKDVEARRETFDENIDIVLKQAKRKNFDDVNLVFFPTIKMSKESNHFYVICFNLNTSEIEIIDNIDNGIDDMKTRYGVFPYALMESFIDYLERKKFQNCYDLILAEPKQVEFPWKTTYNSHDCGVFVMRHMETYLGKGNFLQEFKKEGPGQKVELNMLRAKYMVKILLMSFNEKKKTLLKETQANIKMKPKSSNMLTGNNVRMDEELWKRFNETVIKTIDN